jgi:hypothetical protein
MTAVPYHDRVYRVSPDMWLVCMIEDELGSIPQLATRLGSGTWTLSELAVLIQMMLQSAGKDADYMELGDAIIAAGAEKYRRCAEEFLKGITA